MRKLNGHDRLGTSYLRTERFGMATPPQKAKDQPDAGQGDQRCQGPDKEIGMLTVERVGMRHDRIMSSRGQREKEQHGQPENLFHASHVVANW